MQKRKQSSPLKQSSKAKVRILPLLDNNCNIAPCKGIQDSLELWTPGIGFRIIQGVDSGFRALDSGFQALDSGFQGLDLGFQYWIQDFRYWIPDSKYWIMDSRDWIPDSLLAQLGLWIPTISRDAGFLELYSGFH